MTGAGLQPGDRVRIMLGGSDFGPGFVDVIEPEAGAVRVIVGRAAFVVPPSDLRKVCGHCPDCRSLNERPDCARGVA